MKYIDKFLKVLNTDRNTFATYLFTLISAYLAVDRIVEMLLMIFTGVSYSYWGPIQYTLALACPILAFLFSGTSKFVTSKAHKVTLFYLYAIGLYIIAISMFTQWLNMGAWLLLLSVPNYVEIITDFSELVTPAFVHISLYLPLVTVYPFFKFLYFNINDSKDKKRSIWDYRGISLAGKSESVGPYTCEVYLCHDHETGKNIAIPEVSRYQSLFVCGGSGSGKTSLIFEPLFARDLEKKYFFKEVSKEMGYTALKTGIATLSAPYDNNYLNQNFDLNMLTPVEGKENLYKAYMKKMILNALGNDITYKNIGLTLMTPDFEEISHMIEVCKNFGIRYNLVDPTQSDAIGLNPFVYKDSSKIAITISSVIKNMYNTAHNDVDEAYKEDIVIQAIENVAILLKEMYPRMNDGKLPNLQDMLKMFSNFELIEKMCEILVHNEELKEKYSIQIAYFRKNFYQDGPGKSNMEKYIYSVISQLDNLLRIPGIKGILCNRNHNINFDDMLANADVTFICTRRGDLGAAGHRAFGLFFLLSMQNAVLRRPGTESTRVPHFLYIDEFADFVCKATEAMFTMYRKYKVGNIISTQNLSQLENPFSTSSKNTILSNCSNKILTGNATIDELEWWSGEFGTHREWVYKNNMDMEKLEYDSKYGDVQWKFIPYFKAGKLQTLGEKNAAFRIRGIGGIWMVGPGKFNYLESKYKEPHKIKTFDFAKYANNFSATTEDNNDNNKKFDPRRINFKDDRNEIDPVQTDTTDSNYFFEHQDAIVVNLKNKRKKKF
ncbi:MAG: TraM recognition domain-containing protein [Clostridia bacterium]|nr:TraM recognition domain-containing protein [Clostridia bacterium]